jgi:hypothetical protein
MQKTMATAWMMTAVNSFHTPLVVSSKPKAELYCYSAGNWSYNESSKHRQMISFLMLSS